MGQIEIYEWLKKQFRTGDVRYFTAKEIEKGLNDDGLTEAKGFSNGNVKILLIKLEAYGYLDTKRKGKLSDYNRTFRVKEKYIKL